MPALVNQATYDKLYAEFALEFDQYEDDSPAVQDFFRHGAYGFSLRDTERATMLERHEAWLVIHPFNTDQVYVINEDGNSRSLPDCAARLPVGFEVFIVQVGLIPTVAQLNDEYDFYWIGDVGNGRVQAGTLLGILFANQSVVTPIADPIKSDDFNPLDHILDLGGA